MKANEIVKDIMRYVDMRVREAEDIDWDVGYEHLLYTLDVGQAHVEALDSYLGTDCEEQLREQSREMSVALTAADILEQLEVEIAELRREILMSEEL